MPLGAGTLAVALFGLAKSLHFHPIKAQLDWDEGRLETKAFLNAKFVSK